MKGIIRDESFDADRHLAILEVNYTDEAEWDVEAFNALKESELQKIREEGADVLKGYLEQVDVYVKTLSPAAETKMYCY